MRRWLAGEGRSRRLVAALLLGLSAGSTAASYWLHLSLARSAGGGPSQATIDHRLALGERIYREGILPSGEPLRARLAGGVEVAGTDAACARCHRPSGMGLVEGTRIVPPIAGRYLFLPRARAARDLDGGEVLEASVTRGPDLAHALGRSRTRPPYTDGTLARAVREGRDPGGRELEPLMPRYARLGDEDARLVTEYLRQLSARWSPGVTSDAIDFATVITPDVSPARRAAILEVLDAFFAVHNAGEALDRARDRGYPGAAPATHRAWRLHRWELHGTPDTWAAQLAAYSRREPVFALVSGGSGGAWGPVARFCETERVPCWFPSVDAPAASGLLPADGAQFGYARYFSEGVGLEARLLAERVRRDGKRRVIAIRGDRSAAAGAASALARELAGAAGMSDAGSVRFEERALVAVDGAAVGRALADATAGDAIVLWLDEGELAALSRSPAPAADVYLSATLAGDGEAMVPPAWRARTLVLSPFAPPAARAPAMARFRAWMATRGLPIVDERVQADAYVACLLLREKLDEMHEDLFRDHLIERAEAILGAHVTPGMYHRLSLGPGQRFASKGGSIERLSSDAPADAAAPPLPARETLLR